MPMKPNPYGTTKVLRVRPSLSLHVEPAETKLQNVDAEQFFGLAEKWLKALKAFASDTGLHVRWEIIELKKASAFVQVRPVEAQTLRPIPTLVRDWDNGIRSVQKSGRPPEGFKLASLQALQEFVKAVPSDNMVSLGRGATKKSPLFLTAETQRMLEQAIAVASSQIPLQYSVRGTLRGRLAVLNSWNPDERSFRLQISLAPGKPVNCTYRDEQLVRALGAGFEGVVEVEGLFHYKREEVWPNRAEVFGIRLLAREQVNSLQDLVGLIRLPEGHDSVNYVRSLRDAE
jgi:hypothetical protein